MEHTFNKACPVAGAFCNCAQPGVICMTAEGNPIYADKENFAGIRPAAPIPPPPRSEPRPILREEEAPKPKAKKEKKMKETKIDHSDHTPEEEARLEAEKEKNSLHKGSVPKEMIRQPKTKKAGAAPKKEDTQMAAKKTATKTKTAPAKKAPKAKKAAPHGTSKSGYVRRGEKDGTKSNRGPKGNPPSKIARNAADGGKWGLRLAKARKAKGLSQKALAEKVGMTQPAICNIEKGTVAAGPEAQKKLGKAVGI